MTGNEPAGAGLAVYFAFDGAAWQRTMEAAAATLSGLLEQFAVIEDDDAEIPPDVDATPHDEQCERAGLLPEAPWPWSCCCAERRANRSEALPERPAALPWLYGGRR